MAVQPSERHEVGGWEPVLTDSVPLLERLVPPSATTMAGRDDEYHTVNIPPPTFELSHVSQSCPLDGEFRTGEAQDDQTERSAISSQPSPGGVPIHVRIASNSGSSQEHAGESENSRRTSGQVEAGASRQQTSPLNSGLWLSIELVITLSQIAASIIVLALSRHEKPQAPLGLWIVGYALGCLFTLPLLYWRYAHRFVRLRDAELSYSSSRGQGNDEIPDGTGRSRSMSLESGEERTVEYSALTPPSSEEVPARQSWSGSQQGQLERSLLQQLFDDTSFVLLVERFKIALDCFFAVWFVIGNVWVFGGHASPADAPNLYKLCVVFLTFSCIGYAVPFILCATICCCLPCIIALMGIVDEPMQGKGATLEVISSLPTFKYMLKGRVVPGDRLAEGNLEASGRNSDSEDSGEVGLLWAGTDQERAVSGEDAVCCICLGKYSEGEELRELPCVHHFHVSCVDTWLKINANCPLCKHEISGGKTEEESGMSPTVRRVSSPV